MTGEEWLRDGHSFDIEKKRHRRMVWRAGSNPSARLHAYLHRVTPLCNFYAQLDDYKAAEREREGKRDRSARARPACDAERWANGKKVKRELLAAEWAAEQQQACRAVELTVRANGPPHTRANGYPLPWDIKAEGDLLIPCPKERVKFIRMRNKQMAALRAAAWEEQVREGRFVRLHVWPSHDYRHILEWKRSRGGRPSEEATAGKQLCTLIEGATAGQQLCALGFDSSGSVVLNN